MLLQEDIRITLLAAAIALAGPAFAQGTMHQDPGGTPDSPAARHSKEVMDKKSQSNTERDAGVTKGGVHTDPGGTPDSPAARHSESTMKKKSQSRKSGGGDTHPDPQHRNY